MRMILAAASAAALAAGLATPASAAGVAGARVEAIVGLDRAQFDRFASQSDVNESGVVFGIGVGYDLALSPGVSLGVDLEASDSTARFREVSGGNDISIALGRDLYAGGRVTVAVSPALNLYLKAGYTNLQTRGHFVTPTFAEDVTSEDGAARLGVGAQIAVGANAYVGAEARYSSYDADLERTQGVATLGFRF